MPASARIRRGHRPGRGSRGRAGSRAPGARSSAESRALRDESARPSLVADGRDDPDLELEVQVADELLHDRDLLRVLAAEVGDVGADDREQLQAGGRDAAEVAGPRLALEPGGRALRLDPGREARPDRTRRRPARRRGRHRPPRRRRVVGREIGRVGVEVGRLRELRRVDEDARDDDVALRARRSNSAPWPACSAPIVGTSPTVEPARAGPSACRSSATVGLSPSLRPLPHRRPPSRQRRPRRPRPRRRQRLPSRSTTVPAVPVTR